MKYLLNLVPIAAAVIVAGLAESAYAVTVLNFEGISATYPGSAVVLGFYSGGTSSDGKSGANYGITFTNNARTICLNTPGVQCSNTSRGGLGDPASTKGALVFGFAASQTYMDVAAGFDTGFSFYYVGINSGGSIAVYDGFNGTGNLLASLSLPKTSSGCGATSPYAATFCPFYASGIAFNGIAKSVSFAGVADQIVFDDVTFGSITPGVPEPESYALMFGGLVALCGLMRRQIVRQFTAA